MAHRVVVVTGANSGIGLAMTRALLRLGDLVAALDISDDRLESLAAKDDTLRIFGCDVTGRERPGCRSGRCTGMGGTWACWSTTLYLCLQTPCGPLGGGYAPGI